MIILRDVSLYIVCGWTGKCPRLEIPKLLELWIAPISHILNDVWSGILVHHGINWLDIKRRKHLWTPFCCLHYAWRAHKQNWWVSPARSFLIDSPSRAQVHFYNDRFTRRPYLYCWWCGVCGCARLMQQRRHMCVKIAFSRGRAATSRAFFMINYSNEQKVNNGRCAAPVRWRQDTHSQFLFKYSHRAASI